MNLKNIYPKILCPDVEIKTALEIGPGAGDFSNFLDENGVDVTAIDTVKSNNINPGIYFETMKFEDYRNDQVFDLVHARNVIPFFKNKPKQLSRILKLGKYVFFTFFGPNDPWHIKDMTIEGEAMTPLLKNMEIIFSSEREYEGPTMKGDLKHWHVFTYLVKTNL